MIAWIFSFVPLLAPVFGVYGLNGLECKTRKCTVIINEDGMDLKHVGGIGIGGIIFVFSAFCLVCLNLGIYLKLRVIKCIKIDYIMIFNYF